MTLVKISVIRGKKPFGSGLSRLSTIFTIFWGNVGRNGTSTCRITNSAYFSPCFENLQIGIVKGQERVMKNEEKSQEQLLKEISVLQAQIAEGQQAKE